MVKYLICTFNAGFKRKQPEQKGQDSLNKKSNHDQSFQDNVKVRGSGPKKETKKENIFNYLNTEMLRNSTSSTDSCMNAEDISMYESAEEENDPFDHDHESAEDEQPQEKSAAQKPVIVTKSTIMIKKTQKTLR